MSQLNLEYLVGAARDAARIVSTLVEEAANQAPPPELVRPVDGRIYLMLLDEDLTALMHAVYEAERFTKEARAAFYAKVEGPS